MPRSTASFRRLAAIAVALTGGLTVAAPAIAAPAAVEPAPFPVYVSPYPAPAPKSPALAATVSALGPLGGLLVVNAALAVPLLNGLLPGYNFDAAPYKLVALPAIGFGAGQAYAGDPWRGALVGLGGVAISSLGFYATQRWEAAAHAANHDPESFAGLGEWALGTSATLVATLGYGAWAAYDAYRTAERENQSRATR